LNAGLSGAGRLHDLCINLEAASPGEIKAGGEGWTIVAGYAESPFGECLIAESPRGICHLSFEDEWARIECDWPNAELVRDDQKADEICESIFLEGRSLSQPGTTRRSSLRLLVRGTAFQVKVWRALLEIPQGKLASYGRLAELVGNPKASRAVGTAVGNNPIGYLIPCHRVIRETGAMGGYRWGAERKRAIQVWEKA
jgi:AraC family transcriptional regulator of adaptative response/methylated-DNA-[protein]-cysteine methyltransferase